MGAFWPDVPLARSFGRRMRQVAATVQGYWGAFAHTGDPNGGGAAPVAAASREGHGGGGEAAALPVWPRFRASPSSPSSAAMRAGEEEAGQELTQVLAETTAPEAGYLQGACDFWDRVCGEGDCFGPA